MQSFNDPMFMDIEKNDFYLQANSPLKDLGFEEITLESIGIYKVSSEYRIRFK